MKVKNLLTGKTHEGIHYYSKDGFEEIWILPGNKQLFNHDEQQEFKIIKE